MKSSFALASVLAVVTVACGDDTQPSAAGTGASTSSSSAGVGGAGGEDPYVAPPRYTPSPMAPLSSAPLTTEKSLEYTHALVPYDPNVDLKVPSVIEKLSAEGWGDTKAGAPRPVLARTLDDSTPPAPGPNAKMLSRFVHLADTQLADDESPARFLQLEGPGEFSSAFRPHESYVCRILNAAVRTINKVHETLPIEFVILGGDNADSAQENELDWFNTILDGSDNVECDSGLDNDPVPGPDNDPKDPFVAEGLKVPWRWVMGNHDILIQGNISVEGQDPLATGTVASTGTRDWQQPGGPATQRDIPADPKRKLMPRDRVLEKVMASKDGHGIDAATRAYGKAYYTFDVAGGDVRFLVLDTAAETGGSKGLIRKGDLDKFIVPALDKAKADGKMVILTSHHASRKFNDGGLSAQDDAVSAKDFTALLGKYPNVLMHLGAHSHEHHLTVIKPVGGTPYWEAETSALVDYPHQVRVFEVWDQDNGFYSMRAVAIDFSEESDPLVVEGRKRGVIDHVTDNARGSDDLAPRNVELFVKKPTL